MVTLLIGKKGTGKTKKLIALANEAVAASAGNVVVIEKGAKLTYDVTHKARLIDTEQYLIEGYDMLFGFISGICAGKTRPQYPLRPFPASDGSHAAPSHAPSEAPCLYRESSGSHQMTPHPGSPSHSPFPGSEAPACEVWHSIFLPCKKPPNISNL